MTSRRTLCNVRGCNNNIKYNRRLSFFTLPKDEERRDIWLKLIGRPDLMQKKDLRPASHSICSDHFDASMIILIPKLKPEAIPTKNLPGTRNVSRTSKDKSSDTSESESSDSDSEMSKVSESKKQKENIQNVPDMVEVIVQIKEENHDVETVRIKKEKDDSRTEHIKEKHDDSVTGSVIAPLMVPIIAPVKKPVIAPVIAPAIAPVIEPVIAPITAPFTVHVKVEKDYSDSEHVEGENNDSITIHTSIKQEKQDSDTETSDSATLKSKTIPAKIQADTPSTSTYSSVCEDKLEANATDTGTQTMFHKLKKIKKNNKKLTTEPSAFMPVSQTSDSVSTDTARKRTLQNIKDSDNKRRKV